MSNDKISFTSLGMDKKTSENDFPFIEETDPHNPTGLSGRARRVVCVLSKDSKSPRGIAETLEVLRGKNFSDIIKVKGCGWGTFCEIRTWTLKTLKTLRDNEHS